MPKARLMTAEDVEKNNARVRADRKNAFGALGLDNNVDAELRSLGVPMHLLPKAKPPRMNKLEAEWAMVLEARKRAGQIIWYGFEAIKLRLADNTHYTPDFAVVALYDVEPRLEFHETKGFWRDDARVKIKVAAEMFQFFKFFALKKRRKKDGGGWDIEGF